MSFHVWVHILYGSRWWKFMRTKVNADIHCTWSMWCSLMVFFLENWFKPYLFRNIPVGVSATERKVFTLLALYERIYGRLVSLLNVFLGHTFSNIIIIHLMYEESFRVILLLGLLFDAQYVEINSMHEIITMMTISS